MPESATYPHGHHESVLRSHSKRTVENSAAYLLKYIQPAMHILDIGCGPGTITTSFARLVPQGHVTGLDAAPADSDVFVQARAHASEQGITNVTFDYGDVCHLAHVPSHTYDIVHCHQVLQYVADPVGALREMRRVAKPGGVVAAREADAKAFAWYPEREEMEAWAGVARAVARANGSEPDAGRRVVAWALEAGFERSAIEATAGAWCYSTAEERAWFGGSMADRTVSSTFATHAIEKGIADRKTLEKIAAYWREWAASEDGWFGILHGEIVCRV